MKQDKLNVGIVGLGRMGLMHAAIINSLPNSQVVAVADPSIFPSKPLSMLNPKIRVYKNVDKMLTKNNVDCVLTTAPPHSSPLFGLFLKKTLNIQWVMVYL